MSYTVDYIVTFKRHGHVSSYETREYQTERDAMTLYRSLVVDKDVTDLKVTEKKLTIEERRIV